MFENYHLSKKAAFNLPEIYFWFKISAYTVLLSFITFINFYTVAVY